MARQNDFLRHDYRFVPSSPATTTAASSSFVARLTPSGKSGRRRADMYVYAEPPGPEGDVPPSRATRSSRTTRTS